jgi:hypothetical protein
MKPFREIAPVRAYTGKRYNDYSKYKPYLAKDFNHKCGYTDCSDSWFGGKDNFHIDHFIPWKKHVTDKPHLKTDYSNLVYCCSYVNIAKSNDESLLYLDPCDSDYNEHFQREDNGKIIPLTDNAKYMYQKMKLYLERYHIIWLLDQLYRKIEIFESTTNLNDEEAKSLHYEILVEFRKYWKYLNKVNE